MTRYTPLHHGSAGVAGGGSSSAVAEPTRGRARPAHSQRGAAQAAAPQLQLDPAPHGLTCSSSIMRTERSLSSCCRSSIISRRRSSAFSSSQMSGEPIPSSLSSARRRFGEEPLNSCRRDAVSGNGDQP